MEGGGGGGGSGGRRRGWCRNYQAGSSTRDHEDPISVQTSVALIEWCARAEGRLRTYQGQKIAHKRMPRPGTLELFLSADSLERGGGAHRCRSPIGDVIRASDLRATSPTSDRSATQRAFQYSILYTLEQSISPYIDIDDTGNHHQTPAKSADILAHLHRLANAAIPVKSKHPITPAPPPPKGPLARGPGLADIQLTSSSIQDQDGS